MCQGAMANLKFACVVTLLLAVFSVSNVEGLAFGYYAKSCPGIELKIEALVLQAIRSNFAVAPQFMRMVFHDCFVEGCDASILLDSVDGTPPEKDSIPDDFLNIYPLLDQLKADVEAICPGVVSCADILAFGAAASVAAVGGPPILLQGGRLDGLVSSESEAQNNIPAPFFNLQELISSFAGKGLSVNDLVILSGAHTVGVSHCSSFNSRLAPLDPSLDPTYATQLNTTCNPTNFNPNTVVSMDTFTPTKFDTGYYQDVATQKGLFTSDAALYGAGSQTKGIVDQLKNSNIVFSIAFANSFIKLTEIGVKTGANGNIRAVCSSITPAAPPLPAKGFGFGKP